MLKVTARLCGLLLLVLIPPVLPRQARWERAENRRRRARRTVLWLASYGIDAGPRTIHGVAVR